MTDSKVDSYTGGHNAKPDYRVVTNEKPRNQELFNADQ